MTRRLIVNADDFGRSAGINAGIAEAHERGIVTSASLMVRWPAAGEAAAYARLASKLSVGLHVDLGEWTFERGEWKRRYRVVDEGDAAAVRAELGRQLERFRELIGRDPSHLDSHQHVHAREPAARAFREAAAELGTPLRGATPSVCHYGGYYGQKREGDPLRHAIGVGALVATLRGLDEGVTELACHPGRDDALESTYAAERAREVETLCDPRVRRALEEEQIELISFADVRAAPSGQAP